jgi:hypothetical protein
MWDKSQSLHFFVPASQIVFWTLRRVPMRNAGLPALFSRSEKATFFEWLTLYGWLDPAL